jgi:hypothetical protein
MTMRPVAQRLQKPSSPASIAPQLLAARDCVPGRKFFVFVIQHLTEDAVDRKPRKHSLVSC